MFKPFFYGYVLLTIATVGLVEARERAADPRAIGQHQIVLPGTGYGIVLPHYFKREEEETIRQENSRDVWPK
jgi:hypothetical protein